MRLSVIITPQNQQYRVDNEIMSSVERGGNWTRRSIVKVTVPRHSGIIIDVKSRTPSIDDEFSAAGAVPGRGAATNERPALIPVPGTGPGLTEPSGLTGDVGEDAEGEVHQQRSDEDVDVETDSEREGRPPQPRVVESRQPSSDLILQRWVKVRARLSTWRLACHSSCGRVCSVRRQKRD